MRQTDFLPEQSLQAEMFTETIIKSQSINMKLVKVALDHFRSSGFPYPELTDDEKVDEFNQLQFHNKQLIEDGRVASDSTGVSLANSYHPHRYTVKCGEKMTAAEAFSKDHILERVLVKCLKMNKGITKSKLLSMISIFSGVQVASNFPTATAKAIYNDFLPTGGYVWDMSCGWGGRLLASLSSPCVFGYYGCDPSTKTFKGLSEMLIDLRRLIPGLEDKMVDLVNQGSEVELPAHWPSVDLCFTSPPYFNTEKYAREETQSFLKYPYPSEWMRNFIGDTLRNCAKLLTPRGRCLVNIANVSTYTNLEREFVKTAEGIGFILEDTWQLQYMKMPGQGKKNHNAGKERTMRTEPIFILKLK
jgi:hypothetical protein